MESKMNIKFLVYATGWIMGLLTEARNRGKCMVESRGNRNLLFVMNHSFETVGFEE